VQPKITEFAGRSGHTGSGVATFSGTVVLLTLGRVGHDFDDCPLFLGIVGNLVPGKARRAAAVVLREDSARDWYYAHKENNYRWKNNEMCLTPGFNRGDRIHRLGKRAHLQGDFEANLSACSMPHKF
jgi:hypothetical protein